MPTSPTKSTTRRSAAVCSHLAPGALRTEFFARLMCTAIACVPASTLSETNGPSTVNNLEFRDVTRARSLDFRHASNPSERYALPEIMGSGAALFDYDNDNDLDIYLVNSAGSSRLFSQQRSGVFVDVTLSAGLGKPTIGMGAALGDIDNDGDIDLFVTNVGKDTLYQNNGDGSFTDITDAAGIAGAHWSTSAAFCDVDNNGYLDLYVATYVESEMNPSCTTKAGEPDYCPPNVYPAQADQFFLNNGDGKFTDEGHATGIARVTNRALGVVCADFSGDHRADFLVANDGAANFLWVNQGDTFVERAVQYGVSTNLFGEAEASMGIALGDINDDLAIDAFMTHIDQESNTLYTSTDAGTMMDSTISAKLGYTSTAFTGFGVAFFDADNDRDLDLAIANGRVRKTARRSQAVNAWQRDYAETNLLLQNDGGGVFFDACSGHEFCTSPGVSRGLLAGDIDRDGDLDLLLTNSNGAARLFENRSPSTHASVTLRIIDPRYAREAIGAQVRAKIDGRWYMRPVIHTTSYLSSGDAAVHFGLGTAGSVDELLVIWPDGTHEAFPGLAANQRAVLRKGEGRSRPDK